MNLPDGKWIVFGILPGSSSPVVFIQPFPGPGARVQVTPPGARALEPMWAPDGSRLFFAADTTAMVVDIRTSPSLSVGTPRAPFDNRSYAVSSGAAGYDVSPDGRRLLKFRTLNDAEAAVVHNWRAQIDKLLSAASR